MSGARCPETGLACNTAYRRDKCRCDVCVEFVRAYEREAYRRRVGAQPRKPRTLDPAYAAEKERRVRSEIANWTMPEGKEAFFDQLARDADHAFRTDLTYIAEIAEAYVA